MRLPSPLRRLVGDTRAVAGVEFALSSGILVLFLMNGLEVARYTNHKMELKQAVRAATQAAWKACTETQLPMLSKCGPNNANGTTATAAITTGLQSTSLGTAVTNATGYPTEGYYCVNSAGTLTLKGAYTVSTKPSCANTDKTTTPGDYLVVKGQVTYVPMSTTLTVGRFFGTTLTHTEYLRVGK